MAERSSLSGLALLDKEMARQDRDAAASFDAVLGDAAGIAGRIRATGRLTMLGMGASHWTNRVVLASYRAAGVIASTEVLSEYLRMPQPEGGVTLIASQSGGSGEVAAWLSRFGSRGDQFGLTLSGESVLARSLPSLVAPVEGERAFAATRSIMVTLALHGAVLDQLGIDMEPVLRIWRSGRPIPVVPAEAVEILASCRALYLSSRGSLNSALEIAALTFMELARVPASAFELGQLLHGPMESLSPDMALVLARPVGSDAAAVTRVAEQAVGIGLRPILFDFSDQPPVSGATTIVLPPVTGLEAAIHLLPDVQRLAIEAAARRVADFGTPLRSSKVTDGEAP